MRKNILVIGDLHARYQELRDLATLLKSDKSLPQPEETDIIQLGDLGALFFYSDPLYSGRDETFKKKISNYGFRYFVVRGNHEQRPSCMSSFYPDKWKYFYMDEIKGYVWAENDYPNIIYLDDKPAVYNFNGRKTLTLPGAYSVDKDYRLAKGWFWTAYEQMTEAEQDIARDLVRKYKSFDIILSHTCPIFYEPTDLFLSCIDQNRVDKTMERFLGEIELNVDYKLWLFGHFHATRVYPKYQEKQMIMLFNEKVLDLNHYFKTFDAYGSLLKIEGETWKTI